MKFYHGSWDGACGTSPAFERAAWAHPVYDLSSNRMELHPAPYSLLVHRAPVGKFSYDSAFVVRARLRQLPCRPLVTSLGNQ